MGHYIKILQYVYIYTYSTSSLFVYNVPAFKQYFEWNLLFALDHCDWHYCFHWIGLLFCVDDFIRRICVLQLADLQPKLSNLQVIAIIAHFHCSVMVEAANWMRLDDAVKSDFVFIFSLLPLIQTPVKAYLAVLTLPLGVGDRLPLK